MAHIRKIKLKKGIAHQVVYSVNGAHQFKYFPPEIPLQTVKRFVADLEYKKAHLKSGIQQQHAPILLSTLGKTYCDKRASEIDTSRDALALELFIRSVGNIPANSVTHHHLHQYRDLLLNRRLPPNPTPQTEQRVRRGVNKELKFIRTIFNWAFKQELIQSQPFVKVNLFRESTNVPEILTKDEINSIYHHLPRHGQSRLVFQMMRYSGRRRSEILRLKHADLDLINGLMHINKAKNNTPFSIPMHPKLIRILAWALPTSDPGDKIFTIKPNSLTQAFRRAMVKSGLRKKMPSHILRHSFGAKVIATYLTTGDGERIAMEALGQKSRTMARHYTQIAKTQLGEALSHVDL